ncbi:ATP synthase d subunit [Boothiomyces sp. JEL0866]|nr:ATP synthase d subunit [Boothiomyces sp. JEL0866]
MVKQINWLALANKLKPETIAQVNAFRARHLALVKQVQDLKESPAISFDNYKILKNQKVLTEAKKSLETFKPATLDLNAQLSIIEKEKVAAIAQAKQTEAKIKEELVELNELLVNIENARPIDQMTIDDVATAYPALDATVEKMAKRGQWRVPGYYEKFGEFSVGF